MTWGRLVRVKTARRPLFSLPHHGAALCWVVMQRIMLAVVAAFALACSALAQPLPFKSQVVAASPAGVGHVRIVDTAGQTRIHRLGQLLDWVCDDCEVQKWTNINIGSQPGWSTLVVTLADDGSADPGECAPVGSPFPDECEAEGVCAGKINITWDGSAHDVGEWRTSSWVGLPEPGGDGDWTTDELISQCGEVGGTKLKFRSWCSGEDPFEFEVSIYCEACGLPYVALP